MAVFQQASAPSTRSMVIRARASRGPNDAGMLVSVRSYSPAPACRAKLARRVELTMNTPTPPNADEAEMAALLEQARTEAQARVADVHVEEGTVASEVAQNSPHPDDHD